MNDSVVRCSNPWCQSTNVQILGEVPRLPSTDEGATPAGNDSARPMAIRCNACGKEFVREVPLAFVPRPPAR